MVKCTKANGGGHQAERVVYIYPPPVSQGDLPGEGGPSQGGRPEAAPQWCSPKTCAQSKKVYLIATNSFGNHPRKNRDAYCILTPNVTPTPCGTPQGGVRYIYTPVRLGAPHHSLWCTLPFVLVHFNPMGTPATPLGLSPGWGGSLSGSKCSKHRDFCGDGSQMN